LALFLYKDRLRSFSSSVNLLPFGLLIVSRNCNRVKIVAAVAMLLDSFEFNILSDTLLAAATLFLKVRHVFLIRRSCLVNVTLSAYNDLHFRVNLLDRFIPILHNKPKIKVI